MIMSIQTMTISMFNDIKDNNNSNRNDDDDDTAAASAASAANSIHKPIEEYYKPLPSILIGM